ncbi:MAG: DUF4229 domain-containing protein [Acidimicrobiales bacterium]
MTSLHNRLAKNTEASAKMTDAGDAPADDAAVRAAAAEARGSHAALRYTTLRLAIFVVVLGLLWLVRVQGLLLVALALLISGLASYVLLHGQRAVMSRQLAAASRRRRGRAASRAAREDDIADELAREQEERLGQQRQPDSTE